MHSRARLFASLWTVARQAPLSMGFSRQEYRSGLPFLPPRDLPDLGAKPMSPASPALAGFFITAPCGKSIVIHISLPKWLRGLQRQRIPCLERIPRCVCGREHFYTPQGMHHAKNDRVVCYPNTYISAQILHLYCILPGQVFMKNVVLLLQREINVYSNINLLWIFKEISK